MFRALLEPGSSANQWIGKHQKLLLAASITLAAIAQYPWVSDVLRFRRTDAIYMSYLKDQLK